VKYATCFFSVNDTHYPVETAPRGQSLIPCYRQPCSSNRRQERHGTGKASQKHVPALTQCRPSCCVLKLRGSFRHTAVRACVSCVSWVQRGVPGTFQRAKG